MHTLTTDNESDEDDYKNDEKPFIKRRKSAEKLPLWDSFQDIPPPKTSGSAANQKKFNTFIKCLKCFTFVFVFITILFTGIVSKITFALMASNIRNGSYTKYYDFRYPYKQLYAFIPEEERLSWIWSIIFAFSVPEIFTFFRAVRINVFKSIRVATLTEILLIGLMETIHVIGLSMFVFIVLPEFSTTQGLLLTSCVCFIPGILGLISGFEKNWKSMLKVVLNGLAIFAHLLGFFVWLFIDENKRLVGYSFAALILISFRWWENYISCFIMIKPLLTIAKLRKKLTESRYYIYLYMSPWKIIVFTFTAFICDGHSLQHYFMNFVAGWTKHDIVIKEFLIYSDHRQNNSDYIFTYTIPSSPWKQVGILLAHVVSSHLCYIFAKFACKIKIQKFSFSCPLSATVPAAFIVLAVINSLRDANECRFCSYLPDASFNIFHTYDSKNNLINDLFYIWILWWLSQIWITRHIWFPENDKNASTEKLFIAPWYSSLMVDQCIMLNRRRLDKEDFVLLMDVVTFMDFENVENFSKDVRPGDKIPQLIVCATMWHENEDEMKEFLKSILRLDEDQCARRMAKKYLPGQNDDEYYELESHIFFDDAFVVNCPDPKHCKNKNCIDPDNPPINKYVEKLVSIVDEAAYKVFNVRIHIKEPEVIKTPYGGRLIWILPGRTKLVAHLKNVNKIRNKKRWSQVMYMYYLLGYRIMQMENSSPQRKTVIAHNTFILALDGDIDFQPEAVQLLLGRMKVNPNLAAACGRIHPVGKGPMVWFQKFEYAIGHWLQKSTEHVIGCVLCSPGCFSLFRGLALIENSVIKKYTTISKKPRHYVQYDQGEDRWLCTLLLKQKFRVEYSAASDAYTHSPEGFFEFYKQRRRWIPSTIANILDLLTDAKIIVKRNDSISILYIGYQGLLMIGNILSSGTIFLMMVGALVTVFNIDIWTSFLWNFFPVLFFMIVCYYCKQDFQLITAFIISTLYSFVMMAVLIGIILQAIEDGIFSPASIFFSVVTLQIVLTAFLHPQEWSALVSGFMYYITIPSMYMLLMIYSVFNINDISWGTREDDNNQNKSEQSESHPSAGQNKFQNFLGNLKPKQDEKGVFDFSFGGLFRCMFCTQPKIDTTETQLKGILENLSTLNEKLTTLEVKVTGPNHAKRSFMDEQSPEKIEKDEKNKFQRPGWLTCKLLEKCRLGLLSIPEQIFWEKFIEKYLQPLKKTKKEQKEAKKELDQFRNNAIFAFVMFNSLFVLIVFLLQVKKDLLHFRWPFNVKNTIVYDDQTLEVKIFRKYLELDPIGSSFILLFGVILVIQFIAMLFHRFETISQILATTELSWNCLKVGNYNDESNLQQGTWIELAKYLQRPVNINEKDSTDDEDEEDKINLRKSTIHKIHIEREKNSSEDWSDLEKNFERRWFENNKKLKYGNIPLNRKSIKLIDEKRKNLINLKQMKTSNKEKEVNCPSGNNNYNGYANRGYVSDEM